MGDLGLMACGRCVVNLIIFAIRLSFLVEIKML